MYLGIDIGGTKTLIAALDDNGVILEQTKFPTGKDYDSFLVNLENALKALANQEFHAAGVAAPGRVHRDDGSVSDFGNLPWHHVGLQEDVEKLVNCPVVVENDANLGALSEAMMLRDEFTRVLYVTISTGIGTGFVVQQQIDPGVADMEGGQMLLEYKGEHVKWESFASGHAIVERFGKKAQDITDDKTWKRIAYDWALGFYELIAIVEPEVIVVGGSVGVYFDRYAEFLKEELRKFKNPLTPIPVLCKAQRPEEAVVYGCYDIAREVYGSVTR